MERSAEWLRGALESHINTCNLITSITSATKSHPARQGLMAAGNELHNQLDRYRALLAAAEAREAFPIPDTLPAVPETREAGEPTAAEVIEELHGCFDTIKHLSADIGTESGDIAVNGVALLGLAKIARWKEANGGK